MDAKPFAQLFKGLWITVLILAALLVSMGVLMVSGCAGTRPEPVAIQSISSPKDSITHPKASISYQAQPADLTSAQVAQLPRSVQRQYRKNLRAQPRTVPLIQGRAAVAAAGSITAPVQTSYKPEAAVVQATDSAKVQVAQSKQGPAVAGNGNQVPVITQKESWLRPLLPYAAGAVGLALLYSLLPLGLAGSGWLWVLLRSGRSREPETG